MIRGLLSAFRCGCFSNKRKSPLAAPVVSLLFHLHPYCSICIPTVPDCVDSVWRAITFAAENSKT